MLIHVNTLVMILLMTYTKLDTRMEVIMFKKLIENFKEFEKITYKIMNYGLKFCFAICLISVFILLSYNLKFHSPYMYYIGISLFRLSLIFGTEFIICAFVADNLKKGSA